MKQVIIFKREFWIHLSLVLFISANALRSLVLFNYGSSLLLALMIALPVFCIVVISGGKTIQRISSNQIIIYLFLLAYLIASYAVAPDYGEENVMRIIVFFLFGSTGALLISAYRYSTSLIFGLFVIIGLLIAPIVTRANYSTLTYEAATEEWMGVGYNILPFIIASVYYLFFGKRKVIKLMAIILFVVYIPLILSHAARGTIVAIVLSLFLVPFLKYFKLGSAKILIVGIVILTLLLIISPFFLSYMAEFSKDTTYSFIDKFFNDDDISNGRFAIYDNAVRGFISSPFWGNFVGSFDNYTSYPHNIFLQFLYEGGLILFLPMAYLTIEPIVAIIKNRFYLPMDAVILISFLLLISVIELLFSASFWQKQSFWLYIWTTSFIQIRPRKRKILIPEINKSYESSINP